jgi:hypothetical protein
MILKESKMIIFWMILMKFKGYIIQLTISVKTDEIGNKSFCEEFFYNIAVASLEALGLLMEQDFIPIVGRDYDGIFLVY